MKGWLSSRAGVLALRADRFYYRLQWGFLTQHLTETSAASNRYCVHDSSISSNEKGFKVSLQLGPLGLAHAQAEIKTPARRLILLADNASSFQMWVTCLLRATNRHIREWYTLGQTLGQGSDGVVTLGVSKESSNVEVAIKQIPLRPMHSEDNVGAKLGSILREIQLQHKAARRSKYVASILDVFFDVDSCYIIMEYGNRGSLSRLLHERQGQLSEQLVRSIIIQLGRCLLALHQSNIVHRDVKCDNIILFQSMSSPLRVFLSDFGFAAIWRPPSQYSMYSFCQRRFGTESYIAPEIVNRERYGSPADIFSLGVVCHVSLVGEFPFGPNGTKAQRDNEQWGNLAKLESCTRISADAVSFCKALLNKDPLKRPTAAALLQHKWLRAGKAVTVQPRRRLSRAVTSHVVLRRVFYVMSAVFALQRLARDANRSVDTEEVSARTPI